MPNSAGAHVRIIDQPCGSGKTTTLLKSFTADRRYLVVMPMLTEVERVIEAASVPFCQPVTDGDFGTKRASLENLLRKKRNIATTHQLYTDIVFLARNGLLDGYDVIVDEVPEVLTSIGQIAQQSLDEFYVSCGYALVEPDGRIVPTEKWHRDHELVGDTLSERHYQFAASGCLYVVNQTFLLWAFPTELLRAGRSFTVLTYLAEGSLLLPYLDRHGIPYEHVHNPEVHRQSRRRASELIEIRDLPRLKGFKLSYSGQHAMAPKDTEEVSAALLGLRRGDLKDVPLDQVLVTCAKASWFRNGKGPKDVSHPKPGPFAKGSRLFEEVTWVPNTTRGTNDHAHCSHLVYLYDQHPNPAFLMFLGKAGNQQIRDEYALAELIQVVYRTRVRNGKKVVVYIPSKRMRGLLKQHLEDTEAEGFPAAA